MKKILFLLVLFVCLWKPKATAQTYSIYECTIVTEVDGKEVEKKDIKLSDSGVFILKNNVAAISAGDYYDILYCDPKTYVNASEGEQKVFMYDAIDSEGGKCKVMVIGYRGAKMVSVVYSKGNTTVHLMFFYE